ncbi:hypothetical protein SLE2022_083480 [Rubroshorea leprosula]
MLTRQRGSWWLVGMVFLRGCRQPKLPDSGKGMAGICARKKRKPREGRRWVGEENVLGHAKLHRRWMEVRWKPLTPAARNRRRRRGWSILLAVG